MVALKVDAYLARLQLATGIRPLSFESREETPKDQAPTFLKADVRFEDRWGGKWGTLSWDHPDEIQNWRTAEANVDWKESHPRTCYQKHRKTPPEGSIETFGYLWNGTEVRSYTFVRCNREGCQHELMVDVKNPRRKCGVGDYIVIGSQKSDKYEVIPAPEWSRTETFVCGETLSMNKNLYSCKFALQGVVPLLRESGIIWTMWVEDVLEKSGQVLFRDIESNLYGALVYENFDWDMPKSAMMKAIRWGTLRDLKPIFEADGGNEISFAIDEALQPV